MRVSPESRRGQVILAHTRSGHGKELMFLHGWGCTKDIFSAAYAMNGFCITCVDFFGFGDSPAPAYPVNLDYYASAVAELMQAYNMEDVILIGHSFGGRVCLKLAKNSRVAGMVLVDSAGLRPKRKPSYYCKVLHHKLRKIFHARGGIGSADYESLSGAMKKTFINIVNEDLSANAKAVPCPVLLIWGSEDRETPIYMLKRFQRLLPTSRTVIFEGCGHFACFEQADRFYSLVRDFARELV